MKAPIFKFALLGISVSSVVLTAIVLVSIKQGIAELPERRSFASVPPVGETSDHGTPASGHGKPAASAGHGAPTADAHGAAPADAHGAPTAGGHGEAAASGGHGEPAAGGHGSPAVAHESAMGLPLFSVDELYVNVDSPGAARTLGVKLEIELFSDKERSIVEQRVSAIRHTVIQAAREQEFSKMSTLAGKLYFKELLASRLNEYFGKPIIREIHFSSFYMQ